MLGLPFWLFSSTTNSQVPSSCPCSRPSPSGAIASARQGHRMMSGIWRILISITVLAALCPQSGAEVTDVEAAAFRWAQRKDRVILTIDLQAIAPSVCPFAYLCLSSEFAVLCFPPHTVSTFSWIQELDVRNRSMSLLSYLHASFDICSALLSFSSLLPSTSGMMLL